MEQKKPQKKIEIFNRKSTFEYHFLQEYQVGIILMGTEIKSIRLGNANLSDAYCFFDKDELYVRSLFIGEYSFGNRNNHESRRTRKLLLRRAELNKLSRKIKEKGNTIVPFKITISERGFAKLHIALAVGKKSFDKRNSIKEREDNRTLDRIKKSNQVR